MRINHRFFVLVISSVIPWIQFSSCHNERHDPQVPQNTQPNVVDLPVIDENRLMDLCRRQLSFGSRVPGTPAHDQCMSFLIDELKLVCDSVYTQSFTKTIYDRPWKLTNIIAHLGSNSTNRVMLCAHWDSRPRSDGEDGRPTESRGIPGANDGASGVAVVLELARCLHQKKPEVGIDIVLFDGEDIGYDGDSEYFCVGSREFAQNFPLIVKPRVALLFDMVGDKEAHFMKEPGSVESAGPVVDKLWSLGRTYAPEVFLDRVGAAVLDDHVPLIEAGIPAVNIIDVELIGNDSPDPRRTYWHTQRDELSNLSAKTMAVVVNVTLRLLYSSSAIL